jgi:ketosteroid isomerase-like protein
MKLRSLRLAVAVTVWLAPRTLVAQHEQHQPGVQQTSAALTQCARVQPVVDNVVDGATARLETARQSNKPSDMRAAIDDLEAALRDIRVQLEPCRTAPSTADPHAGHTMPGSQPAPGAPESHTPGGPASTTPAAPARGAGAGQVANSDAAAIEAWLKGYDAAFNAKDLDRLATFYHSDVTIYEGGGVNDGWIDYRDRHLGPELKAFENLQFGHSNTRVRVLPGGQSAYATSEYFIKARMNEREIDSRGLETLVLLKGADGTWKIRHSHTSSRPARKPGGP